MNDTIWSLAVRERDYNQCRLLFPGCMVYASDAHHIYGRVHEHLRYELLNGIAVCRLCHNWIESNDHRTMEIMPDVLGPEQFDELVTLYNKFYRNKDR